MKRRISLLSVMLNLWAGKLSAQFTNAVPDQIPPLRPPRGEIPATFWDRYTGLVILAGAAALLIASGIVWLLTRPKPTIMVPPETQARTDLAPLVTQPENGALLSRVSQILRHYVAAAFELPPGEMTTAEFSRSIATDQRIGAELSAALASFLRDCDERKFAPPRPMSPLGAPAQALKLVDAAQARREELRRAAQSTAAAPNASPSPKP